MCDNVAVSNRDSDAGPPPVSLCQISVLVREYRIMSSVLLLLIMIMMWWDLT